MLKRSNPTLLSAEHCTTPTYLQGTRVVPVPPLAANADSGLLVACSVEGALKVTLGGRGLLRRDLTIINLMDSICHMVNASKIFSLSGYYLLYRLRRATSDNEKGRAIPNLFIHRFQTQLRLIVDPLGDRHGNVAVFAFPGRIAAQDEETCARRSPVGRSAVKQKQ